MTNVDLFGPASASGAVLIRPGETRSFGTVDTWHNDCSSPSIDDGTQFNAAWFNSILANVRAIARGNGQTAGGADIVAQDNAADDLLWRACQHLYQRAQPAWSADTSSTVNQLIVALSPAPPELKAGMRIRVKIANANTGATTVVVNGNAPVSAKTVAGQDLQKGMLIAGQIAEFVFDGTNFQLVSTLSEKVVFTPYCTVAVGAIASVPRGAWTTHGLSAGTAANMAPTVGANSFSLPDGFYMFNVSGATRVNSVINATNVAHQIRLTQNGAQIGVDFEADYLLAGQDLTTNRNLVCFASVVAADTLQVQSWVGTTLSGDFNGGNALAGTLTAVRIGN
jgi:hypothetical protein